MPSTLLLCPALLLAAPAALDPCALVTQAEAAAAMGVAAEPGKRHSGRAGESCRWYSPDHQKNVYVKLVAAGDLLGARQLGGKPVSGIGDEAVWAGGSLFLRKGSRCVQVGLYLSAESMQRMDPEILVLGRAVAGRM